MSAQALEKREQEGKARAVGEGEGEGDGGAEPSMRDVLRGLGRVLDR